MALFCCRQSGGHLPEHEDDLQASLLSPAADQLAITADCRKHEE